MNREAAFFGAQVYSIFSGHKPMVDIALQKRGLLTFIESLSDCQTIDFKRKPVERNIFSLHSNDVLEHLVDKFISQTAYK